MNGREAKSFLRSEQGGATAWCLTWLVGFGIMAGLAIDSANGYRMQTIMQATADSAALAAAIEYVNSEDIHIAKNEAELFTGRNMPATIYGTVLDKDDDVVFGYWDSQGDIGNYLDRWIAADQHGNLPDDLDINAVRVTLRRTHASGNPVRTSLLTLVGLRAWDVQTVGIAQIPNEDNCYNKGLLTKGRFASQSNNQWLDGICIYAEDYMQFGSDVFGDDDPEIVLIQDDATDDFLLGSNGSGIFPASSSSSSIQQFKDEYVDVEKLNVDLPDKIPQWYDALKDYTLGAPWPSDFEPPFTPTSVETDDDVENPVEFRVYKNSSSIVFKSGNADGGSTLQNVVAIAGDAITIDSSITKIRNVLFLAHKHDSSGAHQGVISIPSSTQIGDGSYCSSGDGWNRFAASKDLLVGSNSQIAGAQFIAGLNLYLGSDGVSTKGIAAQVGSTFYDLNDDPKIEPASSSTYGGCAAGFISSTNKRIRLVF